MGTFGESLTQGFTEGRRAKQEREQAKMEKDYASARLKKMDLEEKMMQSQFQGQQDLMTNLFKPPESAGTLAPPELDRLVPQQVTQRQMVPMQGPMPLVPYQPQMDKNGDPIEDLNQQLTMGPGGKPMVEQPRPMGPDDRTRTIGVPVQGETAPAIVKDSGGLFSGMSPQLQQTARSMLQATGGDLAKVVSTLGKFMPGQFPQEPKFDNVPINSRMVQTNAPGGPKTVLDADQNQKEGNPTEGEMAFAAAADRLYKDKYTSLVRTVGRQPKYQDYHKGGVFQPQEIAAIEQEVLASKSERRRQEMANAGVNAVDRQNLLKDQVKLQGEVANFYRYNTESGQIDQLADGTMTETSATEGGYRRVPTTLLNRVEQFNSLEQEIKPIVKRLRGLAEQIITAESGPEAITQGLTLSINSLLRSGKMVQVEDPLTGVQRLMSVGEATALYQKAIQTYAEPFARNINGLRGASTEGDVQRAIASFATISETGGMSKYQFDSLESRLDDVKRSAVGTLFGGQAAAEAKRATVKRQASRDDIEKMAREKATQDFLKRGPMGQPQAVQP